MRLRRKQRGNCLSGCLIQLASNTNVNYATKVTTLWLKQPISDVSVYICTCNFWAARYSGVHVPRLGSGRPLFLYKTFLMLTGVYKKAIHLSACMLPCIFQPEPMHHHLHATHLSPTNALRPSLVPKLATHMHLMICTSSSCLALWLGSKKQQQKKQTEQNNNKQNKTITNRTKQ